MAKEKNTIEVSAEERIVLTEALEAFVKKVESVHSSAINMGMQEAAAGALKYKNKIEALKNKVQGQGALLEANN